MTNSPDSVIVYSGVCPSGTATPESDAFSHGAPTLVEVSQVTVQARPMSQAEIKKASEYFSKSVDVAKALIQITDQFLDKENPVHKVWKDKLKVISAVGDILKGVMKFVPGPPNPMIKNLQDLVDKVELLEKKISASFDEMKSFISEVSFFVGIISPTSILMRYMRDCLKNPGPEAVENFRMAYERHPPLKLAYNLMSYLAQDSTNPLKQEMKLSKIKTKPVFQKWADITCRVLGEFLMLETFANGLLGKKDEYSVDKLWTGAYKVFDNLMEWKHEYMKDQSYWEEVKSDMDTWMSNLNQDKLSNEQKADLLKEQMDTYLTSDNFYIFVFDHCEWEKDYTYRCKNEKNQIHGCWGTGGVNAFIYRSLSSHQKTEEDYAQLSKRVMACQDGQLQYSDKWKKEEKIWLKDHSLYSDYGFVCLIYDKKNVHVRFLGQEREPGRFNSAKMIDVTNNDKYTYVMYVAFE